MPKLLNLKPNNRTYPTPNEWVTIINLRSEEMIGSLCLDTCVWKF